MTIRSKKSAYTQKVKSTNLSEQSAGYLRLETGPQFYTSDETMRARIDQGSAAMSYKSFEKEVEAFPFSLEEWAYILDTTTRTLQRKREHNEKFGRLQSERILEIQLLMKRGHQVFGSKDKYTSWITTPNIIFQGKAPKELLVTGFGIDLLFDALGRIEHGVFA